MPSPSESIPVLARRLVYYSKPKQLQLVVRIAELGTIQGAALALGMSQPTATQSLSKIEELLDTVLFDRHARGIRLTPAGILLVPAIKRALAAIEALANDAIMVGHGAGGLVRIAGISAASTNILAPALLDLFRAYSNVWIEYEEVTADRIPEMCRDDRTDLVLCRSLTDTPKGFKFIPITDDHHSVFCAMDHPLANEEDLTLASCGDQVWLLPPTESRTRKVFAEWCERESMVPKTARLTTRSLPVIVSLIRHLHMLYVGPDSHMRGLLETSQLRRLPLFIPGALDPIGLLKSDNAQSTSVELVARHLLTVGKFFTQTSA